MDNFDEKNAGIIDSNTFEVFKKLHVLIIGVGGIGGHLTNHLVRLGVSHVHLCDYDAFQPSNINRQLFSKTANLGQLKVDVLMESLKEIRSDVKLISHPCRIEKLDNDVWSSINIVFDALDTPGTKLYLEKMAAKFRIPLIHGAIAGWYGQVGIVTPGYHILDKIYDQDNQSFDRSLGSPTFTPAIIAGIMVSEMIKYLQGNQALVNKVLMIDLLNHEYQIVGFDRADENKEIK